MLDPNQKNQPLIFCFDFIRTYQILILSKKTLESFTSIQKQPQAASIVRTLFSSLGQKSRMARRKS